MMPEASDEHSKDLVSCPLCGDGGPFERPAGQDDRRYYVCPDCRLLFVHPGDYLSAEEEVKRYLTHNNGPEYPGYVKFLRQAVEPALAFIPPESSGLDYGCGHAPTLSKLMEAEGCRCADYDPFFFPELPEGPFDFIFCTETAEHFYNPEAAFTELESLLKPGGLLIIMTMFWKQTGEIRHKVYFRDDSHVVFYHQETIRWIAGKYNFRRLWTDHERVAILQKRKRGQSAD